MGPTLLASWCAMCWGHGSRPGMSDRTQGQVTGRPSVIRLGSQPRSGRAPASSAFHQSPGSAAAASRPPAGGRRRCPARRTGNPAAAGAPPGDDQHPGRGQQGAGEHGHHRPEGMQLGGADLVGRPAQRTARAAGGAPRAAPSAPRWRPAQHQHDPDARRSTPRVASDAPRPASATSASGTSSGTHADAGRGDRQRPGQRVEVVGGPPGLRGGERRQARRPRRPAPAERRRAADPGVARSRRRARSVTDRPSVPAAPTAAITAAALP